jgi:hypothetical protein
MPPPDLLGLGAFASRAARAAARSRSCALRWGSMFVSPSSRGNCRQLIRFRLDQLAAIVIWWRCSWNAPVSGCTGFLNP